MTACYGFVLVFDVTRAEESLKRLAPFVDQIRSIKSGKFRSHNSLDFPCILLGNKCDLIGNIPEKQIQTFCTNELRVNCPIYYVSAKTRKNIEESFEHFVKILRGFETAQPNAEWQYPNAKKKTKEKRSIFASFASDSGSLSRFEDDGL